MKIRPCFYLAAAILTAMAGHAAAQSFTIDPDGIGDTKVTVDGAALTSLGQFVPGSILRMGLDNSVAGSLLLSGPWSADGFAARIGFGSTLRLENGVDLQDITLTSPGIGPEGRTVSGRIELDNSSLTGAWLVPGPNNINAFEYQLENNAHFSMDFDIFRNGGDGYAPFELGLTPENFVNTRPHDLRVSRILTGSTLTTAGLTHITRAGAAEVAANGHNLIIDGGTLETNRFSIETLGDPALAVGGMDFRSGTIRILDMYPYVGWLPTDLYAWFWFPERHFNQDAMDGLFAGIESGPPATPVLVAGQTLQFAGRYNPVFFGTEPTIDHGMFYEELWFPSRIASTLEIRGGRLLLGPEDGWMTAPGENLGLFADFEMIQRGSEIVLGPDGTYVEGYAGPNPTGPFILNGGQFDFAHVEFTNRLDGSLPTYLPQFREGTMRGGSLEFEYTGSAAGLPIVFGEAGKLLTIEMTFLLNLNGYLSGMQIADGATVSISSPNLMTPGLVVGDGATLTLSELTLYNDAYTDPVETLFVGLDSTLQIETLNFVTLGSPAVTCDIGAGSLVELERYAGPLNGLRTLSTGPGTLRLMAGALEWLAPNRRAMTVGGNLELDPAGTMAFSLLTPTTGTSYAVAGDLDLGGSGLSVTLADEIFTTGERTLIAVGGTRTGTFAGFPEGTLVESRLGVDLYLSYTGGDGNDIVLTTSVQITHDITPSAGANGSISPNTVQAINEGATAQFTVNADAGFSASVGGSCGGSLAGSTYTTEPITTACSVEATFTPQTTLSLAATPLIARVGEPFDFTMQVTGIGSAPSDGEVTATAGTGESCSTATGTVNANTVTFNCTIAFASLGLRTIDASFGGSTSHEGSNASPVDVAVMRVADVSVNADDGLTAAETGQPVTYLIEVRNAGPDSAPDTAVVVTVNPALQGAAWTCTGLGGASCSSASGSGDIGQIANLPAAGGLDFELNGTLPDTLPGTVMLQAEATVDGADPNLVHDPATANNSATDTNLVPSIFNDVFEALGP